MSPPPPPPWSYSELFEIMGLTPLWLFEIVGPTPLGLFGIVGPTPCGAVWDCEPHPPCSNWGSFSILGDFGPPLYGQSDGLDI